MAGDILVDFASITFFLDKTEMEDFLSLGTDSRRRDWIEEYWRARDPVRTTRVNESRLEHNHRVQVADSLFCVPEWPGWDRRGEVYIRYGQPTIRHIQPPELIPDSHSPVVPPGEVWLYANHNMFVLFEDSYSSGRYSCYLERIEAAGGVRSRGITQPIDAVMQGVVENPAVTRYMGPGFGSNRFEQMVNNFADVLESTPCSYECTEQLNRLPVYYDIGDFRGGERMNRVEVHVQFVANVGEARSRGDLKHYRATTVLWDLDHNEAGRDSSTIGIPVVSGVADSLLLMPLQLVTTVPPGFYHLGVTVEETETGDYASYGARVKCRDYDSFLEISDLLFASRIADASGSSPFNRGPLQVIPHPIRRYNSEMDVPVYFELYNLETGQSGLAEYTVEYHLKSLTPRQRGFWGWIRRQKSTIDVASSFRSSCEGPNDSVTIQLGLENLWAGKYALDVRVVDNNSFKETTREAVFRVVE
jgi:GWxTD domain-containing protein